MLGDAVLRTFKAISDLIREWYRGTYIPPPPNDRNSALIFILAGHYEQPPLAKIMRVIGLFWLNHWKFIITTIIAVIGGIWLKGRQ
jgi:hypothetical protein